MITRIAKFVNGKCIYDPPFTPEEEAENRRKFVEMCQARRAPMMKGSDRAYLEGQVINHGLGDSPRWLADRYVAQAKRAGIDITGKIYRSGLADGRGPADPEAWVGSGDDFLGVCKRRHKSAVGLLNYQAEPQPEPETVPLSEQAISELVPRYLAEDPDWARKPRELREHIVDRHGAPAKKRRHVKSLERMRKKLDMVPELSADAD